MVYLTGLMSKFLWIDSDIWSFCKIQTPFNLDTSSVALYPPTRISIISLREMVKVIDDCHPDSVIHWELQNMIYQFYLALINTKNFYSNNSGLWIPKEKHHLCSLFLLNILKIITTSLIINRRKCLPRPYIRGWT